MIDLPATADCVKTLNVISAEKAVRNSAVATIRASADRLLTQFRTMAELQAPFSAMVVAWIAALTQGLQGRNDLLILDGEKALFGLNTYIRIATG